LLLCCSVSHCVAVTLRHLFPIMADSQPEPTTDVTGSTASATEMSDSGASSLGDSAEAATITVPATPAKPVSLDGTTL
jgi:hypothetical protein